LIASVLERTKKIQWVDRGWYLVTEFEKTPSINFQRAVELAKTYPGFIQLMDERRVLIYRNIYHENGLLQFQELYKLIKNWKGTKLYFKGDKIDFDVIESGISCYIQTKLTGNDTTTPESYENCENFNNITLEASIPLGYTGCRRSCVSMEWNRGQSNEASPCWFFFGSLDQHKVYRIHKEELEQTVIGHLIEYYSCPLLDLDRIREFIRQLPDRIDPRKDKEWKYRKQRQTNGYVGRYQEPTVLPISEEAYRMYLKRKLQHYQDN
jgi:hypothetical protein